MGLFSTIDAILNLNMKDALEGISLPDTITEALIQKSGILYPIYLLMISYEQGEWNAVEQLVERFGMDEKTLSEDYMFAIRWTKDIMDSF